MNGNLDFSSHNSTKIQIFGFKIQPKSWT